MDFPLVIEASEQGTVGDFYEQLQSKRGEYKQKLLKHGALLFRNFPLSNEEEFSKAIGALGLGKFVNYIGGDSPRDKVKGDVYTSTEAPPSVKIPLHNELSFIKNYPRHIYFYCHVAPESKGETILADARKVYHAMDENVRKRFEEKGLKYFSCYYYKSPLMQFVNKLQRSHKSWIEVFETEKKEDVERKCREGDFSFTWNQNDWLQIVQSRPAAIEHPETREKVWFNQAHLFDFNPKLLGWARYVAAKAFYIRKHMRLHEISFANEEKIPRQDLYHILDVLDAQTVATPWRRGDFLVLDNVLAMHGRAPFQGPRKILTALTA